MLFGNERVELPVSAKKLTRHACADHRPSYNTRQPPESPRMFLALNGLSLLIVAILLAVALFIWRRLQ